MGNSPKFNHFLVYKNWTVAKPACTYVGKQDIRRAWEWGRPIDQYLQLATNDEEDNDHTLHFIKSWTERLLLIFHLWSLCWLPHVLCSTHYFARVKLQRLTQHSWRICLTRSYRWFATVGDYGEHQAQHTKSDWQPYIHQYNIFACQQTSASRV